MYRVALGYDLHRLSESKDGAIVCGGVEIPCDYRIDGAHSDGDVVFHALTDALFSVIGKDIGVEFPNTDPQNKKRQSDEFLVYSYKCMELFYKIMNIDIIVICDYPKIASYALEIRKKIASYLKIDIQNISIRGKTTENTRPLTIEAYTNVLFQKI